MTATSYNITKSSTTATWQVLDTPQRTQNNTSLLYFKVLLMTNKIKPCMTDFHCVHLKRILIYVLGLLLQVAPPSHTPQLPPTTHHHNNPDYRWKQVRSSNLLSSPFFIKDPENLFSQSASCHERWGPTWTQHFCWSQTSFHLRYLCVCFICFVPAFLAGFKWAGLS